MKITAIVGLLACSAQLVACGDSDAPLDTGTMADTGAMDDGAMDGGARDAAADGSTDGAATDSGGADGAADAMTDSGAMGDGAMDSSAMDSSAMDSSATDSGSADTGADGGFGTAMSFFVSSAAPTNDGNLGGLAGADAHCVSLATAAGAVRSNWVAYLSTVGSSGSSGTGGVDAVDRIGSGPWYNADGDVFSLGLVALHPTVDPDVDRAGYIAVKPADALFMDENGDPIPSNTHDVLTGTDADGTVQVGATCNDWTSNSGSDVARVGHTETPGSPTFSPSWNSAHDSRGCAASDLPPTNGTGLIYCFATD